MNSHPIPPISNFIKKKGGKIQEGGLDQNPRKKTKNQQNQTKDKKSQNNSHLQKSKLR